MPGGRRRGACGVASVPRLNFFRLTPAATNFGAQAVLRLNPWEAAMSARLVGHAVAEKRSSFYNSSGRHPHTVLLQAQP